MRENTVAAEPLSPRTVLQAVWDLGDELDSNHARWAALQVAERNGITIDAHNRFSEPPRNRNEERIAQLEAELAAARRASDAQVAAGRVFEEPFDTPEWEDELEAIRGRVASGDPASDAANLLRALDAETHDSMMFARNLSTIYDSITFGLVSKPNMTAEQVIELYEERLMKECDEAVQEALAATPVPQPATPPLDDRLTQTWRKAHRWREAGMFTDDEWAAICAVLYVVDDDDLTADQRDELTRRGQEVAARLAEPRSEPVP